MKKRSTPPVIMTTLMSVDCWADDSNRLPSSAIESKSEGQSFFGGRGERLHCDTVAYKHSFRFSAGH